MRRVLSFRSILPIALPLTALCVQLLTWSESASFEWLFFYIGVALSAWLGSLYAGIFATIISTVFGLVFFIGSGGRLIDKMGWPDLRSTIAFVGIGFLLSFLFEKLRSVRQAAAIAIDELQKANEALQNKEKELSELSERLQSFDRLKSRFLVDFSHELRTPLTLILGYVQSGLATQPSEELRSTLLGVRRNSWILLEHVNDLLEVTKLDSGSVTPVYNEIDLTKVIRQAAVHFDAVARSKGCEFFVEVPSSAIIQTDAEMVQRILVILLSNAFSFISAVGKVRCTLRPPNDEHPSASRRRIVLEVADNGPGIPKQYREIIFDRYFQGDEPSLHRMSGAGLGLVIAKDFVKLLAGEIKVASAPEGGALFKVEIPIEAPPGAQVGTVSADLFREPTLPLAAALSRHLEPSVFAPSLDQEAVKEENLRYWSSMTVWR